MDEFTEKLKERINQWNKTTQKGSEMLEQLYIQDHSSNKSKSTIKDEQIFIENGAKTELLCNQLDLMYTDYNQMIKQLEQQEQEIEVPKQEKIQRIVQCLSMFEQEYKLKKTINESIQSGSPPPTTEQISTVVLAVWNTQPYISEKLIKEII
ncbi:10384_t:CDS:2 [Ambispora gerdemannii]|uniref:10384_t:CDS:1 n=1 Tax=Ambispora gerdemannii TaxID=144530 RepID=A0A9N9B088_9GLOM|nr:10384_t:CDS:2 [Ambispora gerdemannii]